MFRRRGKDQGRREDVQFLQTERQDSGIYHVHRGRDVATALRFLRQSPVKEEFVYVIVETPEGNVGRDLIYIFDEADGRPIELAPRAAGVSPVRSETHCAWCGYFVVPVELPRLRFHESVGAAQHYMTIDRQTLYKAGQGFSCRSCSLLQCAVCSDLTRDVDSPPTPVCRSCGRELRVHTEERGPQGVSEPERSGAGGGMVTFPAAPLGDEMWGLAPLQVPWRIDVQAFLAQASLPYLWPGSDGYKASVASRGADVRQTLRVSWINVFLHHPNPEVVMQCLRIAPPDRIENYHSLADLLASPTAERQVKAAAAKALWGLERETAVRFVLNILLSRGTIASDYDANSVHQALAELRTACPREKARWFEAQLDDGDD